MDYQQIGRRIRIARKKLNLAVEKFSEIIDLTPNYLGNIERGEKRPSLQTLVKISSCLRVSLDYPIYREGQKEFIDTTEFQELIAKCSFSLVVFCGVSTPYFLPLLTNINKWKPYNDKSDTRYNAVMDSR